MKKLRTLERRYIPKLRLTRGYKNFKLILFLPIGLVIYGTTRLVDWMLGRVKRTSGKSELVLSNIIAGWTNLVLSNPVTEKIAIQRASICAACPSAQFVGGLYMVVVDNKTTEIRGLKCGECGCPLSAKVRSSNDYCPLKKW